MAFALAANFWNGCSSEALFGASGIAEPGDFNFTLKPLGRVRSGASGSSCDSDLPRDFGASDSNFTCDFGASVHARTAKIHDRTAQDV